MAKYSRRFKTETATRPELRGNGSRDSGFLHKWLGNCRGSTKCRRRKGRRFICTTNCLSLSKKNELLVLTTATFFLGGPNNSLSPKKLILMSRKKRGNMTCFDFCFISHRLRENPHGFNFFCMVKKIILVHQRKEKKWSWRRWGEGKNWRKDWKRKKRKNLKRRRKLICNARMKILYIFY